MSCWRNYSCASLKNVDKDFLMRALQEMGLGLNNNTKIVGRYESREANVDGALTRNGEELPLGLTICGDDGCVHVAGDFWSTGLNETKFTEDLGRIYQKINMVAQAELAGYTVENVEETADGGVEIEIYAMA